MQWICPYLNLPNCNFNSLSNYGTEFNCTLLEKLHYFSSGSSFNSLGGLILLLKKNPAPNKKHTTTILAFYSSIHVWSMNFTDLYHLSFTVLFSRLTTFIFLAQRIFHTSHLGFHHLQNLCCAEVIISVHTLWMIWTYHWYTNDTKNYIILCEQFQTAFWPLLFSK